MRTLILRRALAFSLALICCLSAVPALAEVHYPSAAYTTTNLRLRQQPTATAKVLLTIPSGDMVLVSGESGAYYIAAYEGVEGYALKQYVTLAENGVSLPAVTPAPEGAASLYPVLYSGNQGEAVQCLQEALKELGYYTGSVDGKYGSGTRQAVIAFQAGNKLSQTGTADGATQVLLYEGKPKNKKGQATAVKTVSPVAGAMIGKGSTGPMVVKLQNRLKVAGYYTGPVDGNAGNGTVTAIKAFQKKNGLSQTGKADLATQALLYSDQAVFANTTAAPKAAATPAPLPTALPASEEAVFPFTTYTTSSVNLRKAASTSSTRLTTVPKGAEVQVQAISGKYLLVSYKKLTGYIVSDYAYVPPQYAPGKAMAADADAQQHYEYLQSGSTGKNVIALQEALKELGFFAQTADGNFGASTLAAVKAFQEKNGIRQDGIASAEMQKLIFEGKPLNVKGKKTAVSMLPNYPVSELRSGMRGAQVTDLQTRLQSQGLYTGSVTGRFDNETVNAVKKFQAAHKLSQDGVAGEKTLQLLYLLTSTPTPAPYAVATPAPAATELTKENVVVIRKGTKGVAVSKLQARLVELGYYSILPDGVYDDDDEAALKNFQRASGLTQDGVAGLATQQALYSEHAVAVDQPAPTPTPAPAAEQPALVAAPTAAPEIQLLKTGSRGTQVTALQAKLKELGYLTGMIDGTYGSDTAKAVKEFQRKNGLTADGVAGVKTQEKLYGSSPVAVVTPKPAAAETSGNTGAIATLRTGDSGDAVRAMQQRLVELGYLTGADGVFGVRTYNAVVAFQKKNGLTADGVAGKMTLNRLNSGSAVASSGSLLPGIQPTPAPAANAGTKAPAVFAPPSAAKVQYANWYSVIRAIAKSMPDVIIYDPDSGLNFNLHMFSFGKHADSETPTAADTAVLNQVVGVNSWTPKYVWVVFPDDQVYIGSIHSHGHEVDHTPNNDLQGHICLHFPRVMSEAEATGPYAVSHQKEINWGWELTQAMAKLNQ